jgi:transposase
MKRTRRKFSASFKTKVAIETIKEQSSLQELTAKFELHPNQISSWKRDFLKKVLGNEYY